MPNPFRLNRNRLTIGKLYMWRSNYRFVPVEEVVTHGGSVFYKGTLFLVPSPASEQQLFVHGEKLEMFMVNRNDCVEVRDA